MMGLAGMLVTLPQLLIARVAADHVHRVGLEKILQRKTASTFTELGRRLGHHLEKRVAGGAGGVVLHLDDQRRHEVEVLVDVGELVQQLDHPVVVLEGMHAHPGQPVVPGDEVLVIRLVHVPEENEVDLRVASHRSEAAPVYQDRQNCQQS